MKTIDFRGNLADISAIKEALDLTARVHFVCSEQNIVKMALVGRPIPGEIQL